MERAALDVGARQRGVEERQIEPGVVADQDRALAGRALHAGPHFLENALQRFALVDRRPQWMPGVDLVDLQCRRFDVGALEGFDVIAVRRAAHQAARIVEFDHHRGDLQQRIARAVESTGLDIDHHRQESTETPRHQALGCIFVHARTAQATFSPARSGTSSPGLKG